MRKICLSLLICTSFSLFAMERKITVLGNLSPAGSIELSSSQIIGNVYKTTQGIEAQRLTLLVSSLNTGISLRDEHLAKYLEAEKYPKIVLTKLTAKGGHGKGTLTIKNVTRPIKFTYDVKESVITSQFTIKRSDFKLADISFLGVSVQEDIEIKVDFPTNHIRVRNE